MTAQSDTPPVSAAEQTTAARIGAVLFKHRGWLPVPFLAIPLLAPGDQTTMGWWIGGLLVVIGEWIRLAGVAAAGSVTRRRSRKVGRLVTYGAFAWSRNPLYNGNFLIWVGFAVISGVNWFIPVAIIVFAIEYSLIVRHEEGVLETIFGEEYLAYKRSTPRWIPRPPSSRVHGPHNWREAWISELSTLLAYAAVIAAFVVKERYFRDWLR